MNYFDENKKQIKKFQTGGQTQDPVMQVIQGLISDPERTIQMLGQMQSQQGGKEQVNAIVQEIAKRAKNGDAQAAQAVQVLQQAMGGARKAEYGAKLDYIKHIKGICPEGTEKVYLKNGGCLCEKAKTEKGDKMENKKEFFDAKKEKCGGKMKKHQDGGQIIETRGNIPSKYIDNQGKMWLSTQGESFYRPDSIRNGITLFEVRNGDFNTNGKYYNSTDSTFMTPNSAMVTKTTYPNGRVEYFGQNIKTNGTLPRKNFLIDFFNQVRNNWKK